MSTSEHAVASPLHRVCLCGGWGPRQPSAAARGTGHAHGGPKYGHFRPRVAVRSYTAVIPPLRGSGRVRLRGGFKPGAAVVANTSSKPIRIRNTSNAHMGGRAARLCSVYICNGTLYGCDLRRSRWEITQADNLSLSSEEVRATSRTHAHTQRPF